jgi:hypothetical protein
MRVSHVFVPKCSIWFYKAYTYHRSPLVSTGPRFGEVVQVLPAFDLAISKAMAFFESPDRKRILHSRAKTSLEKLGIREGYENLFMVIKVGIRKVVWKSFLLHCKWYAKGADWSHTPRIDSGMCIPVCDWLMNHGPFWFSSYRTKLGVYWENNIWLHMLQTLAWVGAL